MIPVGIDRINFYTSRYYLDLEDFAKERGVEVNKFYQGLGQFKMAVPPPDEDIVTMAANAALRCTEGQSLDGLDTILFATESSIDQSKSSGVFVKGLLGLPDHVRVIEMKQACYSATAGLQLAAAWVAQHPDKKVLLIAADIARYGLNTGGESSQGAGAVAMLITANPRIAIIESEYGVYTSDVMDFWRPNYRDEALVDGHYSAKIYLKALHKTWSHYKKTSQRSFIDHEEFCFHASIPRLVEKSYQYLRKINREEELETEVLRQRFEPILHYNKMMGNSYTAALYISLISLLDNSEKNLSNKRIGLYSYGSGCVAEFFSVRIQPEYKHHLDTAWHQQLMNERHRITCREYERFFSFRLPKDGATLKTHRHKTGYFRLSGMSEHKREYEKCDPNNHIEVTHSEKIISALAPGKLILSGEHSVVFGKPALAVAVDRYTKASVTKGHQDNVDFSWLDFQYKNSFKRKTLRGLKNKLKAKYESFLNGESVIKEVLKTPFELTQFAIANWLDHVNHHDELGLSIETESTIPIGCGLGSSAASIVSVLKAVSTFHQLNWSEEQIWKMAIETENLQHGKSSGLDLYIAIHGGCVYFESGVVHHRPIPKLTFLCVNTGKPIIHTGESVSYVAEHFSGNPIWNTFSTVTNMLDRALQANDFKEAQLAIKDNHELLVRIGVVPKKVQNFIRDLEYLGAAAKISGSGAVSGDTAGVVLVLAEDQESVEKLAQQYGYECSILNPVNIGAHIEPK